MFRAAAGHIRLERDAEPDARTTEDYFADVPPGIDPATSHRPGLFDGGIICLGSTSRRGAASGQFIGAPPSALRRAT